MCLIGISTRIINTEGRLEFIKENYLRKLQKYNLKPLILTTKNINDEFLLKLCDGILIPGGGDIDPCYFYEKNTGLSKDINQETDELDQFMINWAVKKEIPLLGICRGIQVINVFMGGNIYQDIGGNHRHIIKGHKVKTIANRFLNFKELIEVNSYHHQAIKDLGNNFMVIARHYDGTIEAIIHEELPIIGIQWHPETLPETDETRIIFQTFSTLVHNYKYK